MTTQPRFTTRREFVSPGLFRYIPQIYVVWRGEVVGHWFDYTRGAPDFWTPDAAINWAVSQWRA